MEKNSWTEQTLKKKKKKKKTKKIIIINGHFGHPKKEHFQGQTHLVC
jgi:hypothetical protein